MRVLAVLASGRAESHSKALMAVAVEAARAAGAEVVALDLLETPLPFFRADDRYGQQDPTLERVRKLCLEADAFLLATPEYHGGMSGHLKNFFDHHYREFAGKLFGLVVATGGSLGTSTAANVAVAVNDCHGWTLPYFATGQDADFSSPAPRGARAPVQAELVHPKVADRLARLGRDLTVYGKLLRERFGSDLASGKNPATLGFAGWHEKI